MKTIQELDADFDRACELARASSPSPDYQTMAEHFEAAYDAMRDVAQDAIEQLRELTEVE